MFNNSNAPRIHTITADYNSITRVIVTPVEISEAFDPSVGGTHPPLKSYECIWDTGATNSVINAKVVKELNLSPTGQAEVHTAGGMRFQNTYLVNIKLPQSVGFVGVKVTEADLQGKQDVLIGMDIISLGDFAITNFGGKTTMSFRVPSLEKINFNKKKGMVVTPTNNLSEDEKRRLKNREKRFRKKR